MVFSKSFTSGVTFVPLNNSLMPLSDPTRRSSSIFAGQDATMSNIHMVCGFSSLLPMQVSPTYVDGLCRAAPENRVVPR
jgi:hypothetical protein